MVDALHLGSLGLAAVGACCTAAASGRNLATGVITALLMLLAMADATLHLFRLPMLGWALALLLAALASGFLSRRNYGRQDQTQNADNMTLHRNLGLVLMAALLVPMEAHSRSAANGHTVHGGTDFLSLVLGGGSVLYAGFSSWLAVRGTKTRAVERLESGTMGLSILAMGAGWIL